MLSPSTRRRSSASTSITAPLRPLSRPAIKITVSPLRIFFSGFSQHLGCERNNLHELHVAQLARHRSENTRADGLELVGQEHRGIGIEADQRSIGTPHAALGAHHHGVVHLALLHLAARDRILDADFDDIANRRVSALLAAPPLDAHKALGAAVVGYIQNGSHLDHWGWPLIPTGRGLRPAPTPKIYDATWAGTA